MSIQIPIHCYEPDPVADKVEFDYAMAQFLEMSEHIPKISEYLN